MFNNITVISYCSVGVLMQTIPQQYFCSYHARNRYNTNLYLQPHAIQHIVHIKQFIILKTRNYFFLYNQLLCLRVINYSFPRRIFWYDLGIQLTKLNKRSCKIHFMQHIVRYKQTVLMIEYYLCSAQTNLSIGLG